VRNKGIIAGYYRVSSQDNFLKAESNSITNQRLLVQNFISSNTELEALEFEEFYDDGYSGTNFERPAIQALLNRIKEEEVACIIVKDFSRFSRDYIEMGSYLEQIFPILEIRFISVTDRYDSEVYLGRTADIDVGFKSLLADFYCKDVSHKVISSLETKKSQGKYATGSTPFGYMKNPVNRNELFVVEEEAVVIRLIFDLSLKGKNTSEIAQILNDRKIMSPLGFKKKRKVIVIRDPLSKENFLWSNNPIHTILTNETYLGSMVYGKSKQESVGSKKTIILPRDEWKKVENHHAAIIDKDTFWKVQDNFYKRVKTKRNPVQHVLKGKMRCGVCNRMLAIMPSAQKQYFCQYNNLSKKGCFSGIVAIAEVEKVIFKTIRCEIDKWVEMDETYGLIHQKRSAEINKKKRDLSEFVSEINKRKVTKKSDLEAYHLGKSSKEEYLMIRDKLDSEIMLYEEKQMDLEIEIKKSEKILKMHIRTTDDYMKFAGADELTTELVEAFVEKVLLYNDKKIDIQWKFQKGSKTEAK